MQSSTHVFDHYFFYFFPLKFIGNTDTWKYSYGQARYIFSMS
jgi:hypothetical protein